jgi:hypothetical protein
LAIRQSRRARRALHGHEAGRPLPVEGQQDAGKITAIIWLDDIVHRTGRKKSMQPDKAAVAGGPRLALLLFHHAAPPGEDVDLPEIGVRYPEVLRPGGVLDEPVAGGDRGGDRQRQRPLLHGPRRPSDPAVSGRHRRPRSDRTGTSATPAIAPLPEPIRRAINREPVEELEWPWLSTSATVT